VNALEPVIEEHELIGQSPLRRARQTVEVPHRGPAAGPFSNPLAHRNAVGTGAVLPLHVIEAVDRVVGQVERRDVLLHRERRIGQIGGEARIGLAVAPQRRRQGRVRGAALVGLPAVVAREPLGARIGSEEMVERAVLEEQHDDVIDRRASAGQRFGATGSSGGARGQGEAQQHHADEPWTPTAHGVF